MREHEWKKGWTTRPRQTAGSHEIPAEYLWECAHCKAVVMSADIGGRPNLKGHLTCDEVIIKSVQEA